MFAYRAKAVTITAVATLLGVLGGGCARFGGSASDWNARTQQFLQSSLQPGDPFPSVHLPQQRRSVYEQSAAVIALRLAGRSVPAQRAQSFVTEVLGKQDGATGYFTEPDSGGPAMVTWYVVRALDALGESSRIGASHESAMVSSSRAALADAKAVPDPFDRIYHYRLLEWLATHGDASVRQPAQEALQEALGHVDCGTVFSAKDVDLWGVAVEMASDAGVACPTTAAANRRLQSELSTVADNVAKSGYFSAFAVERLRSIVVIRAGGKDDAAPSALTAHTASMLTGLRDALASDRIETNPLAVAVAAQLLADEHLQVKLGSNTVGLINSVLQWGAQLATFLPNASLFTVIARSLILLPGSPGHSELINMVNWPHLSGLDRLQVAIALDPHEVRSSDITDAIDDYARRVAAASKANPNVDATDWASAALIAQAAQSSRDACVGSLATWVGQMERRLTAIQTEVARAPSGPLLYYIRFLGFAKTCPAVASSAQQLYTLAATRAADQVAQAIRPPRGLPDVLEIFATFESACESGVPISKSDASAAREVVDQIKHDNTVGVSGDGQQIDVERIYATLRVQQIADQGCPD